MSKVRVVLKPGGFVIASIIAMILAVIAVFIVATQPERFKLPTAVGAKSVDATAQSTKPVAVTSPTAPVAVAVPSPSPLPGNAKPLTDWLVLRPLPTGIALPAETEAAQRTTAVDKMLTQAQLPNESQLAPKAGDTVSVQGQTLTWTSAKATVLDITTAQQQTTGGAGPTSAVGYGVVYIDATKAVSGATLYVGSDDGVVVWLNGKEIWRKAVLRACTAGEDKIPNLSLQEGRNTLVFKIANGDRDWLVTAALDKY